MKVCTAVWPATWLGQTRRHPLSLTWVSILLMSKALKQHNTQAQTLSVAASFTFLETNFSLLRISRGDCGSE